MLRKFKDLYNKNIKNVLQDRFKYRNQHQLPELSKIVINMGVGDAVVNSKAINGAIEALTAISGQKPYVAYAKKSIASFKLREGMKIGCKVTLRRDRM